MKIVIADTGVLISLGIIDKIDIIKNLFDEFYIPQAVWEELERYENPAFPEKHKAILKKHILKIKSKNQLSLLMDYGESESVILYQELNANYLLIDDQKARLMAESLGVNCIRSVSLLILAKQKGLIHDLRSIFKVWQKNERYFSKKLLNEILSKTGEAPIN
ncbi:Predicted nucleic acid-binding protein, contains PIN domain [Tangfeifania diversioriginum]|uniref:Predicted nucleic acid-binding protein, contains PIN domain n=1 Tax=Tangfeifania diversioriginum TaxID=1168035 RepID=A0A1M6KQW4_9BACT|nr:hypothetical protein [Tangfeifania diversioriginum]SHJ61280.1 Predicted nucleic acid-binding protein, contains PIN domain [Tangfeifania diversioriginum]